MDKLDLPFYNSVNFPLAVKAQLSAADYNEHESKLLRYHQFIIKEFLTKTKNRGLLLCHAMGMGKTRIAVAVSLIARENDPTRRILVLSAKSLEANFRKEIMSYSNKDTEYINKNYKFISLNSSNMYSKISNIDKTEEQQKLEKKLGDFMSDVLRDSSLENSMLIIDEAHNLFNAITNGAKNALLLYDLILNTKNIQLIFLSGTPIINDPFELVPCFNMLRGRMDVPNVKLGGKKGFGNVKSNKKRLDTTLFSEDVEEFETFFIDRENKTIKNKDKFTNRIYGLSSYYSDLYFPTNKNKDGYPTELENIIEKIPMSAEQFSRYITARITEQEETKKGFRGKDSRFSSSQGGSSTYRVKSRQISNYCIPEYALGPIRGKKSREKFLSRITIDDLENVSKFSPKMKKIMTNIDKHRGKPGIVYSQFVSGEGLGIFALILKAHGYTQFGDFNSSDTEIIGGKAIKSKRKVNVNPIDNEQDDTPLIKSKSSGRKVFALLTGDINPEFRAKIIKKFNNPKNYIDLLLLSGAVAEGIDLKRTRHVHIMEPFWNYARINQVKTRAIRYESHIDLPKSEQNVQVYIYLSDYPVDYPEIKKTELTTDIDLYTRSIDNMKIIDTFMMAVAESSIDCAIHHNKLDVSVRSKVECKLCSPTNAPLFHPLLDRDMELPSNCTQYTEKKISVD